MYIHLYINMYMYMHMPMYLTKISILNQALCSQRVRLARSAGKGCSLFSNCVVSVCFSVRMSQNFLPFLLLLILPSHLFLLYLSYCFLWNSFIKSLYLWHIFGIFLAYLCDYCLHDYWLIRVLANGLIHFYIP